MGVSMEASFAGSSRLGGKPFTPKPIRGFPKIGDPNIVLKIVVGSLL